MRTTDLEEEATAEDLAAYRFVTAAPDDGRTEHWPTEFTAEEQNWLEGRYDDEIDDYLRRRAPDVVAALDVWVFGEPTWQERFIAFTVGLGRIVYQAPYQPLLHVESAEELMNGAETFDPIVEALAYRSLKTLVVGLSKAGKSWTLWARCAEAISAGRRVLYLTEEPRATVTDKLRTFGLEEAYGETFLVVRKQNENVANLTWEEVVERLARDVVGLGTDLVVVDTVRPWVRLEHDAANSADAVGPAMDALSPVCEAGAAVVVLHQSPWEGKRARNSTEFHAATDLIFHVDGEGSGPRTIKYVGGRVEGIPSIQTFRWTAGEGIEDLGKMRHDKAERLDEVLRIVETASEEMTASEIAEQTDYNERTVQRWLSELEAKFRVVRIKGKVVPGHGGEPDRWRRPGPLTALLTES